MKEGFDSTAFNEQAITPKKSKIWVWVFMFGVVLAILIIGGYFVYFNSPGEPQLVKINSLEIVNVYRNCEKNGADYKDTTLQTTIDVEITKNEKYSEKILARDCVLKLDSNNVESFSLVVLPVPNPYIEGIQDSGLHRVTGAELIGDKSGELTFCCQEKCDTAFVNAC